VWGRIWWIQWATKSHFKSFSLLKLPFLLVFFKFAVKCFFTNSHAVKSQKKKEKKSSKKYWIWALSSIGNTFFLLRIAIHTQDVSLLFWLFYLWITKLVSCALSSLLHTKIISFPMILIQTKWFDDFSVRTDYELQNSMKSKARFRLGIIGFYWFLCIITVYRKFYTWFFLSLNIAETT
jgi:hypothetical protein